MPNFLNLKKFPGRSLFALRRRGVATMLSQELDRLAESMGEERGTGVWSEVVFKELVARVRNDGLYLVRLRKAERKPRQQHQTRIVMRSLLDVIAEETAKLSAQDAPAECTATSGTAPWPRPCQLGRKSLHPDPGRTKIRPATRNPRTFHGRRTKWQRQRWIRDSPRRCRKLLATDSSLLQRGHGHRTHVRHGRLLRRHGGD